MPEVDIGGVLAGLLGGGGGGGPKVTDNRTIQYIGSPTPNIGNILLALNQGSVVNGGSNLFPVSPIANVGSPSALSGGGLMPLFATTSVGSGAGNLTPIAIGLAIMAAGLFFFRNKIAGGS